MSENQRSGLDLGEYLMYANEDPDGELNGTEPPVLPGIQVKFEVEDPEYDQSIGPSSVTAGLLRSFQPSQSLTSSQSAAQWTGSSSTIRTQLRKIMEDKDLDSNTAIQNVHNAIEDLLRKNENVLAKNDAMGYKPHSRRGRPGLDVSKTKDMVFPTTGQSATFSTGHMTQGRVVGTNSRHSPQQDQGPSVQLGQLMRPKSPTRRCAIPEKDKSHFSLALMESKVGSKDGEEIFRVQEHEMVCAISSQTKFLNKEGHLVSSVDINYYWCNFCNFSTTNKNFLLQHVMEHRFFCKHCRYQSFSRADVIHHSVHAHPTFQDTAAITQYCTLLSDYLRIHHPSEEQLDGSRKRKDPPDNEDAGQPSVKVSKNGADKKVQQSYSADFDLFDVHVEELKENTVEEEGGSGMSQEGASKQSSASSSSTVVSSSADPKPQMPGFMSTLISQPLTTVTQSSSIDDGQPVISQVFSASTLPTSISTSSPALSRSPLSVPTSVAVPRASTSPIPTPFFPNSVGAGGMQQMRSSLYWSCGYCKFTSTSQSGIKEHSVFQHSGKAHRYVALLNPESSSSSPNTVGSNGGESSADPTPEGGVTSQSQGDGSDRSSSEEPPVLVKQEPVEEEDSSEPIKVRFPTPRIQPKEVSVLKCYHCSHTSRNLRPLRNHILNRHKGKCLVGVGSLNNKVFMCMRTDCTFRSSSAQTYLSHSQDCTPWLSPDATDVPVEAHLKKSLQATTRIAEETQAASPGSSADPSPQVSYDQFSCIYCKCQFTWSRKQTKQHVLQCHGSQCLIMRNVRAHRNRKRSSVFFCRWCPWEGKRKEEHDLHAVFCPRTRADGRSILNPCDGETVNYLDDSAWDGGEETGEDTGYDVDFVMKSESEEDGGPPDITHNEDSVDRLHAACSPDTADADGACTPSSTADSTSHRKTFPADYMPQLYVSDPNVVDSDDSDAASGSSCPALLPNHSTESPDDHVHRNKRKGLKYSDRTKKNTFRSSLYICRKVNHFQNKSSPSKAPFTNSKLKLHLRKMTDVQCFMCGFRFDSLRPLKVHMQDEHFQRVSFSFRSMYHSSLHLKCRFYACPEIDCPLYRYNEADVVSHYRERHASYPHPYLDLGYTPAPLKFQRRVNKGRKDTGKKHSHEVSSSCNSSTHVTMMPIKVERQYLCLYCDQYYYTDSVREMKGHHVASHPAMPIIVRDVTAYRNKKVSRVYVCEQPVCDFSAYTSEELENHAATAHAYPCENESEIESGWAGRSFQCTSCGWITTDDSVVHEHVFSMHAEEGGVTVVTLDHDDVQHTVEERFISVK